MLSFKLEIKKPKFWQKKWKIKKPQLYILVFKKNNWVNTYWWSGNYKENNLINFTGSAEAVITKSIASLDYIMRYRDCSFMIVGNKGTNLRVSDNKNKKGKVIKGISGNKNLPEWVCFGMLHEGYDGFLTFTKPVTEFGIKIE